MSLRRRLAAIAAAIPVLLVSVLLATDGDDAPGDGGLLRDASRTTTSDGGAAREDRSDAPRAGEERGRVVHVVDGDTVHVDRGGGRGETVRLALVDAPEASETKRGHAECGGREATDVLRDLVDGRTVTLRRPGGEDRDPHGRLVRELVLDGESVDEALLRAGWARQWRVAARDGGAAANRRAAAAADEARRARRGAWARCGGFGRPA